MDLSPILISMKTASLSIAITFVLGLLLARWVLTVKSKAIRAVLDGLFTMPLVLPPTVAGFFLLWTFGTRRPLGQLFLEVFGLKIAFSWGATVLAAVTISLPLMYRSARGAFEQVDQNLIFAGRTLAIDEAGGTASYGDLDALAARYEAAAGGRPKSIQRTAERALRFTLSFSFFVTSLLIVFADPLCTLFFQSPEAGDLLRIMAPIVPIMYVDSVVDGMLKGLDQQMYSFRYNFMDSLLRVAAIAVCLPLWGMAGYLCILFFSEIFNASLSIHRLLKVTELEVDVTSWVLAPAVAAALLYYLLSPLAALL